MKLRIFFLGVAVGFVLSSGYLIFSYERHLRRERSSYLKTVEDYTEHMRRSQKELREQKKIAEKLLKGEDK